jgi:hypothetical protein
MVDKSSDLEALSAFAASLDVDQLPESIVQTAKACLLYGLAVGIGLVVLNPH